MSACIVIWITWATQQTPPGVHSTAGRGKGGSRTSGSIKEKKRKKEEKLTFSLSWTLHTWVKEERWSANTKSWDTSTPQKWKLTFYTCGFLVEEKNDGPLIFSLRCTPGLLRAFNLWRKKQKLQASLTHPSHWSKLPRVCKHSAQMNHWEPEHDETRQTERFQWINVYTALNSEHH